MLLRKMRKKVKIIMWVALILIIPAFIWWGVGPSRDSKRNLLAKVDGIPISLDQFYQAYNILYNRYAVLFDGLTPEQFKEKIEMLNLEEKTFERLVETALLKREIKKRHIKISDDEVARTIQKLPDFRTPEGNFDKVMFQHIIKNTPPDQWKMFEEHIRSMLTFEKLKTEIEDTSPPGENKAEAYSKWLSDLKTRAKIEQKQELPRLTSEAG